MIIISKKRIMLLTTIIVFSICCCTIITDKKETTVETVSLPVTNKTIVIDARTLENQMNVVALLKFLECKLYSICKR